LVEKHRTWRSVAWLLVMKKVVAPRISGPRCTASISRATAVSSPTGVPSSEYTEHTKQINKPPYCSCSFRSSLTAINSPIPESNISAVTNRARANAYTVPESSTGSRDSRTDYSRKTSTPSYNTMSRNIRNPNTLGRLSTHKV